MFSGRKKVSAVELVLQPLNMDFCSGCQLVPLAHQCRLLLLFSVLVLELIRILTVKRGSIFLS